MMAEQWYPWYAWTKAQRTVYWFMTGRRWSPCPDCLDGRSSLTAKG